MFACLLVIRHMEQLFVQRGKVLMLLVVSTKLLFTVLYIFLQLFHVVLERPLQEAYQCPEDVQCQ